MVTLAKLPGYCNFKHSDAGSQPSMSDIRDSEEIYFFWTLLYIIKR